MPGRGLKHIVLVTAVALSALPACSRTHVDGQGAGERQNSPGHAALSTEVPAPGPGLQRLVDIATTDLSAKLDVDVDDIDLVEAAYVTWRDSSIGCPRPDMQYMQVLTNGARIVLRASGVLYHYHSGGNRAPFLCARPSPEAPLPYAQGET
jgi:hypothetical protein